MNILILTVETNYHSPLIFRALFHEFGEDAKFKVLISQKRKKTSIRQFFKKYPWLYILMKFREKKVFNSRLQAERKQNPKILERKYLNLYEVLDHYGISYSPIGSVNSSATMDMIREFAPDIIVSLYFDQILKPKVLDLSKHNPINLHPSLLPAYAGTAPTFWVLSKGEEYAGITIHEMIAKVDEGKILFQKKIEIEESDTQFSLYRRCSVEYIQPLIHYLDSLMKQNDYAPVKANDDQVKSYYSKVRMKDVISFVRRKRKLI